MKIGQIFQRIKESLNKEKLNELLKTRIRNFFSEKEHIVYSPKNHNRILKILFLIEGKIYKFFVNNKERFRVYFFNFLNDLKTLEIVKEILWHSRKLTLILVIFLFLGILISIYPEKFLVTISTELIKAILTAYIGGITALLGIIFALYSIGFQITTAIYSSKVTDYINQERVGRFFFQILVFSAIFILILLISQNAIAIPLVYAFWGATFLTILSLLGILIYKDDYITKLKPRSIFQLIYNQNYWDLEFANHYDSPNIRSFRLIKHPRVRSFRLSFSFHKSWSILTTLQKNTQSRIKIHKILFKDLIKNKSYEDASFGIIAFGYTLVKYAGIKPYIETDLAWWYPRYQEIVTSEDMSTFPIKANYEAQGVGLLHTTKINYSWLEDEILDELEKIQNDDQLVKQTEIGNALVACYELILAGKFEKTELGYEKNIKGLFELQDFETFDKVLTLFFGLGPKLQDETVKAAYLNALGEVKTVITDGFSDRHFPGKLTGWKNEFENNVRKLFKCNNQTQIFSWKQPKYIHELLLEHWNEIQVEKEVEDKYITSPEWLVRELLELCRNQEKEKVDKYTAQLLKYIITLISSGDKYYTNNLSLVTLHLFNQLIYQDKWLNLEKIIKDYSKDLMKSFIMIDNDSFLNLELREPIEFGLLNAIVKRKKVEFRFYLTLFFLTQINMLSGIDRSNVSATIKFARRPLMIGALAYLISELDQDPFFIREVVNHCETLFIANLANIMEQAKDLLKGMSISTLSQVIYEEVSRYHPYYREVINSIFDLPPRYETQGSALYGFSSTATVEHPSSFIRELASFRLSDMDECYEGFVEWLQKREEVKKLTKLLNNKPL